MVRDTCQRKSKSPIGDKRTPSTEFLFETEDSPGSKIGAFVEMNLNGRPLRGEEIIEQVRKVTRDDVRRAAARVKPDTLFFLTRPG